MSKKILVFGCAIQDTVLHMQRVPEENETLTDDGKLSLERHPGGKGVNAATAFTRLGGHGALCARLGRDTAGKTLFAYLHELGLDTSLVDWDNALPTGEACVFVEGDGFNRIVVYPGANRGFTEELLIRAFDRACPDAVYMQTEIPFPTVCRIVEIANERGIPAVVDAGPANADVELSLLPPVEIFSPNENETLVYTGIRPINTETAVQAALELSTMLEAKYYVIKMGAGGALIYDGKLCHVVTSYNVDAVDTAAAGDAFTSALTLEYLRNGGQIIPACKFGCAVGALTVTRPGAAESIPDAAEVAAFLRDKL